MLHIIPEILFWGGVEFMDFKAFHRGLLVSHVLEFELYPVFYWEPMQLF